MNLIYVYMLKGVVDIYDRELNDMGILRNERDCFEKKTRTKYKLFALRCSPTRTHVHTHAF